MENTTVSEGKNMAIISYITIIGTVVAFIMNNDKKNSFASFHIRQMIGLFLLSIVVSLIIRFANLGVSGSFLNLIPFVLWIIGFIGAIQGQEKKVPVLGDMFQDWFKGIG